LKEEGRRKFGEFKKKFEEKKKDGEEEEEEEEILLKEKEKIEEEKKRLLIEKKRVEEEKKLIEEEKKKLEVERKLIKEERKKLEAEKLLNEENRRKVNEYLRLKDWNEIIFLSQGSNSEFRIEIDPDEVPKQIQTKLCDMMEKFSKLQTCSRFQTTLSNIVFQIDFQTKIRAEKVFDEIVELLDI